MQATSRSRPIPRHSRPPPRSGAPPPHYADNTQLISAVSIAEDSTTRGKGWASIHRPDRFNFVREEGLEPPRLAALEPKSGHPDANGAERRHFRGARRADGLVGARSGGRATVCRQFLDAQSRFSRSSCTAAQGSSLIVRRLGDSPRGERPSTPLEGNWSKCRPVTQLTTGPIGFGSFMNRLCYS